MLTDNTQLEKMAHQKKKWLSSLHLALVLAMSCLGVLLLGMCQSRNVSSQLLSHRENITRKMCVKIRSCSFPCGMPQPCERVNKHNALEDPGPLRPQCNSPSLQCKLSSFAQLSRQAHVQRNQQSHIQNEQWCLYVGHKIQQNGVCLLRAPACQSQQNWA